MAVKSLYAVIPEWPDINILSVTVQQAYSQDVAHAEVVLDWNSSTGSIGDLVRIDIGYTDDHHVVLKGYVKSIQKDRPSHTIKVLVKDPLVRAQEYLLAADDPDNPYRKSDIYAEDLIEDLLAQAGITDYSGHTTNFLFAPTSWPGHPGNYVEFNLIHVWDAIRHIVDLLAIRPVWADYETGQIQFKLRPPYIQSGDVYSKEFSVGSNVIRYHVEKSDEDLRNKVVVYGAGGIVATASASSPYLPSGFYKAVVVGGGDLVHTQQMAQDIADYNLQALNRLTETVQLTVVGDSSVNAYDIVRVNLGIAGYIHEDFFVYSCTHRIGKGGYTQNLVLTR